MVAFGVPPLYYLALDLNIFILFISCIKLKIDSFIPHKYEIEHIIKEFLAYDTTQFKTKIKIFRLDNSV